MSDADRLRDSLLDLHDFDHHFSEIDPGEDCEDCVILLAPLACLIEERDRLKAANEALTSLVREEYGDKMSLAEIASTWGNGVTPEQLAALQESPSTGKERTP